MLKFRIFDTTYIIQYQSIYFDFPNNL